MELTRSEVHHLFRRTLVRAECFEEVTKLGVARLQGQVWEPEEYQKALARIRDYGVMNGLTAKVINQTFIEAYAEAELLFKLSQEASVEQGSGAVDG